MRIVILSLLLLFSCVRSERDECLYDLSENDVTRNFPTDIVIACEEYLFLVSQGLDQKETGKQWTDLFLVQCLAYKYRVEDCKKRSDINPQFRLKRRERRESILPGEEL